jgi:magnesium chelatase family protein
VEAAPISLDKLGCTEKGESSEQIRERVMRARKYQEERFEGTSYQFNSQIAAGDIRKYCKLKPEDDNMLSGLLQKQGASARTYHRVLKVSRTIADLR